MSQRQISRKKEINKKVLYPIHYQKGFARKKISILKLDFHATMITPSFIKPEKKQVIKIQCDETRR